MNINQGIRNINIDFYNFSNTTLFLGHKDDNGFTKINLIIPQDLLDKNNNGIDISAVFKRDVDKENPIEIKLIARDTDVSNIKEFIITNNITNQAHRGYLQFRISMYEETSSNETTSEATYTVNSKLIPYIVEESLNFSSLPSNVDDNSLSHVEEAFLKYNSLSKGKIPWPVDSENKIDWGGENQILQSDGKGGLSWVDKMDMESATAWNAIQTWADDNPDKINVNMITPQMCLHSFCEENGENEESFLEEIDGKESIKYKTVDGFVDLTKLVQYTIDKAAEEGKIAYFPKGEYGITSICIDKPVTVMGAGEENTFFHEIPATESSSLASYFINTDDNSDNNENTNEEISDEGEVINVNNDEETPLNEEVNNENLEEAFSSEDTNEGDLEENSFYDLNNADFINFDRSNNAVVVIKTGKDSTPTASQIHAHGFIKRCKICDLTVCSAGIYSPQYVVYSSTPVELRNSRPEDEIINTGYEKVNGVVRKVSRTIGWTQVESGKWKRNDWWEKAGKYYEPKIKSNTYVRETKNGIELRANSHEVTIENVTVTRSGGIGIRVTTGSQGSRLFNIKTFYNAYHGVQQEGYGTFISNLTTNQNKRSGLTLSGGAGQFSDIRSWGNFEHGVYMTNNPHSSMLTNINAQQNHGCGLRMESGYDNVITNFQSMANNFSGNIGKSLEDFEEDIPDWSENRGIPQIPMYPKKDSEDNIISYTSLNFYGHDAYDNYTGNPHLDHRGSGFYINGNNNIIQGSDVRASWENAWLAVEKYGVYVTGNAYNNKIDILCSEGENKSSTHNRENLLSEIYSKKTFKAIFEQVFQGVEWQEVEIGNNEKILQKFSDYNNNTSYQVNNCVRYIVDVFKGTKYSTQDLYLKSNKDNNETLSIPTGIESKIENHVTYYNKDDILNEKKWKGDWSLINPLNFGKSITLRSPNSSNEVNILYKGEELEEIELSYIGSTIFTNQDITLQNDINANNVWDENAGVYDVDFRCAVIDLHDYTADTEFFINAHGGTKAQPYGFYSNNGKKLKNCKTKDEENKDDYFLDVQDRVSSPEGARFLIINNKDGVTQIKNNELWQNLHDTTCKINSIEDVENLDLDNDTLTYELIPNTSNKFIVKLNSGEIPEDKIEAIKRKIIKYFNKKELLQYVLNPKQEKKSYIIERKVFTETENLKHYVDDEIRNIQDSIEGQINNNTETFKLFVEMKKLEPEPSGLSTLSTGYYYFDLKKSSNGEENTALIIGEQTYPYTSGEFKKIIECKNNSNITISNCDNNESNIYKINGAINYLIDFLKN